MSTVPVWPCPSGHGDLQLGCAAGPSGSWTTFSVFVAYDGAFYDNRPDGSDDGTFYDHVIRGGVSISLGRSDLLQIDRTGPNLDMPWAARWAAGGNPRPRRHVDFALGLSRRRPGGREKIGSDAAPGPDVRAYSFGLWLTRRLCLTHRQGTGAIQIEGEKWWAVHGSNM